MACTVACFFLLVTHGQLEESTAEFFSDGFTVFLVVAVHILGASANIASQSSSVSIEKDWVPEIAKDYDSDGHDWLTQTNVSMRQIDLGCKVRTSYLFVDVPFVRLSPSLILLRNRFRLRL